MRRIEVTETELGWTVVVAGNRGARTLTVTGGPKDAIKVAERLLEEVHEDRREVA